MQEKKTDKKTAIKKTEEEVIILKNVWKIPLPDRMGCDALAYSLFCQSGKLSPCGGSDAVLGEAGNLAS